MISKHAAQQIRAGITYAKQVLNHERTNIGAPRGDDYSLFARAYRHTVVNYIKRPRGGNPNGKF